MSACRLPFFLFRTLVPTLLTIVVACSAASSPSATLTSESDVTRAVQPGLDQRVTLTPAELVTGENVSIHSVITNRGNHAVALESRICGLSLDGDIRLDPAPGIGTCGGFSMGGTIAPDESRESTEIRRIASGAGAYTLRVKHALQPERWVKMRVVVRAR
ncbi:MAG: hypothetical protein ABR499_01720 [Gemmatimonadaceae bacterium]